MSEAPEKKKRSPVERLIVWGLIAALLVVVLIEYRASTNFNATREYLEASVSKRPTLDEVKSKISGARFSEKQVDKFGTDEYEISFTSLFKSDSYKLRVHMIELSGADDQPEPAEGDRRVAGYYVSSEMAAVLKEQQDFIATAPLEISDDGSDGGEHDGGFGPEGSGAGPGESGGGGPGGGGQGGARRNRTSRGMLAMVTNSHVKTQLAITDEQAEKIQAVATANTLDRSGLRDMEAADRIAAMTEYQSKVENGVREVLEADQFEAVEKMVWNQEGPLAFVRAAVASKLGLTEDQVAELSKIREGMDFRNPPVDEMMSVLNDEQKSKWESLMEDVEMPPATARIQRPESE